jgi:uncharacterized protein (TIGR03437 family)
VSPGEIIAVFGQALGPASGVGAMTGSPHVVDNLLAGTRIWFDSFAAPLLYVSASQISAIVPYGVAGQASTQVQVEYLGVMSEPVSIPLVVSAPGLFTNDQSGAGQAAALNHDGTRNSVSNPALRGSKVSLFVTGEGQTAPAGADGKIAGIVLPKPKLAVTAEIGGLPASISYAGGATGIVAGGMQVNVEIPSGVAPGPAVPVVVRVGDATSQPGVTLAVQ